MGRRGVSSTADGGPPAFEIGGAEAVSFDVYDTLVARPFVWPTDLFGHME